MLLAGCGSIQQVKPPSERAFQVASTEGNPGLQIRTLVEGVPLPGVEVVALSAGGRMVTTHTDVNGEASFDVESGFWSVTAKLEGMIPLCSDILVAPNQHMVATGHMSVVPVGPVTIAEPPDFWLEHASGRYTLYNKGQAWPVPWR